jgi:hypothetical protein
MHTAFLGLTFISTFSKVSFNLRFSLNFYVGFALGSVEGRVAMDFFDQTAAGLSKRYIYVAKDKRSLVLEFY